MSSKTEIQISPSIIAADLTTLGNDVASFDPAIIDLLHIDVMDGHFVPNLTFGPGYIKKLMSHTTIPLDIHLMIENPDIAIAQYLELKPKYLTIHYESTRFPIRLLNLIRNSGILAGMSINPATPVFAVKDILPHLDLVLIMSVDPGFYGQKFLEISLTRISDLNETIHTLNLEKQIIIQVDGGITEDNIAHVARAGARIVVAGNSAFSGNNVNDNVAKLKKAAMA